MGRVPANVSGDLVRVALMEARPAGLTTRQLVTATELSAYQVQSGLRFLREVLAAQNLTPLTWTRRDGYQLSTDPADWIAYERACVRIELTRVLPRRWIVERSLSWLMRARRNARDYERLPEHSEAHITWANITLMTRRIARANGRRAAIPKLIVA
ncbi:hypothetical protein Acsp01_89490 [Actinoplanes sp. NBRC 101535]|nr:hypothetical protein Acsp01_89490 [Actinoplanes sp. NBRC 101535]